MDYEDKLTDEELMTLLSSSENEEGDTLSLKLYAINAELMEAILDLQEFMEDNNLTSDQFFKWKQQKNMRTYH